MKTRMIALALALAAPMAAHAYKLDRTMSCDMPVRDFFAPLVQQGSIQMPAAMVSPTGANYFHKSAQDAVTFFNMTVGWIVGYANDPLLFKQPSDGSIPNFEGYGFYVNAPIAEVQATLASVGDTKTQVRRMAPDVTYIYCEFPPAQ